MTRRDWLCGLPLVLIALSAIGCGNAEDTSEAKTRPLPPNRLPPERKPKQPPAKP